MAGDLQVIQWFAADIDGQWWYNARDRKIDSLPMSSTEGISGTDKTH